MNTSPAYFISGHGDEKIIPFYDRKVIPHGYILVTLTECGKTLGIDEDVKLIEAFGDKDNEELFANPVAFQSQIESIIGKKIHIYTEGDRYPQLTLSLFLSDIKDNTAMKSGVYKFPLKSEDWLDGRMPHFYSLDKRDPTVIHKIYEDSISPPLEYVQRIMGDHYNNLPILKRAVSNIKIEDIFEEGPGVYYYSSCRGSHVPFATSLKYERTKEANIVKQYINTHADANIIPNIQPKLQEISNIEANRIITILTNIAKQKGMNINDFFDDGLESFQENPSVEHINRSLLSRNELNELIRSNTYDKLEDVRKTGRLYGLMQHTRRLSVNQQSRRGGRRKRRHTRKRTSKKY